MHVRLATRGSELARWQADHVAGLLRASDPSVTTELVVVETAGDRRLDLQIWEMGGKGVFAKEIQAAVLDGRADAAVHSAKDLPAETPDGLTIAAVPKRADPRDALVGCALDELPVGARVATGSARRRVQLTDIRPDLTFAGLRGNIATRVAKVGEFDAVVVAAAAMHRLGLSDQIAQVLEPRDMVPQVAQGALAVECRVGDSTTIALLHAIEHGPSRRAVDAERAFLGELGGNCDLPAGAFATVARDTVLLVAVLGSLDGRAVLRHADQGSDGSAIGRRVARHLLEHGGSAIL